MRPLRLALFGLVLFAAPALAQTNGPSLGAKAVENAKALQAHATEVAAAGKRMDLTRAPARDHFQKIIDLKGLAALPAPAASDMPWMIEVLQAVTITNRSVLFFAADPAKFSAPDTQATLLKNVRQYEDELAALSVFQIKLMPRLMVAADAFMATLSAEERASKVRQEGFAKMRRGYIEAIQGALGFAADPQTKGSNVQAITTAVSESLTVWTKIATPDDRKTLSYIVAALREKPVDGKTNGNLAALTSALN